MLPVARRNEQPPPAPKPDSYANRLLVPDEPEDCRQEMLRDLGVA